jgi:hypothetical protein
MARHVYNGIPITEGGRVKYVAPARAVLAADGKYYPGALGVDARGNLFAYNIFPDTFDPPPMVVPRPWVRDEPWVRSELWRRMMIVN